MVVYLPGPSLLYHTGCSTCHDTCSRHTHGPLHMRMHPRYALFKFTCTHLVQHANLCSTALRTDDMAMRMASKATSKPCGVDARSPRVVACQPPPPQQQQRQHQRHQQSQRRVTPPQTRLKGLERVQERIAGAVCAVTAAAVMLACPTPALAQLPPGVPECVSLGVGLGLTHYCRRCPPHWRQSCVGGCLEKTSMRSVAPGMVVEQQPACRLPPAIDGSSIAFLHVAGSLIPKARVHRKRAMTGSHLPEIPCAQESG